MKKIEIIYVIIFVVFLFVETRNRRVQLQMETIKITNQKQPCFGRNGIGGLFELLILIIINREAYHTG